MEGPRRQSRRTRDRQQPELSVARGYAVERVERSLLAAAYEAVLPASDVAQRGRPPREHGKDVVSRCVGATLAPVTAYRCAVQRRMHDAGLQFAA